MTSIADEDVSTINANKGKETGQTAGDADECDSAGIIELEAEILSTWVETESERRIYHDDGADKDEQEYDTSHTDSDDSVIRIDMDKYNNAVLAEGHIFDYGQPLGISAVYKPNDANRIILY